MSTPGEFVDDHDFAVLHHVVLIAVEERMRAQGGVQVMHQNVVLGRIERFALADEAALGENLLELFVAGFGDVNLMGLLIDPVVAFALLFGLTREKRRNLVHLNVDFRAVFGRAGDDERRAGFVDENRVDFVDDRVVETALTTVRDVVLHVVAKVVEAEFVVRAVGDVGGVGGALVFGVLLREDLADRKAQPVVEAAHPVRVAARQVVVHRHDVAALARQGVEVDGERGRQGLAFARAHFGDLAVVEHHAADELHVEVTHAEDALRGLANDGEGLHKQIVRRGALGDAVAEFLRLGPEFVVRKRLHRGFEPVDLFHLATVLFDEAIVATAENFGKNFVKHCSSTWSWFGPRKKETAPKRPGRFKNKKKGRRSADSVLPFAN